MLQNIKSVLVGVTEDGEAEKSVALSYALSLAQQADAHLTVHAASLKLSLPYAAASDTVAGLVATENERLATRSASVAERALGEANAVGVKCQVENPHLLYPDLVARFLIHAAVHDLSVLDLEPKSLALDRTLLETVLFESGRPVVVVPPGSEPGPVGRVVIAWDGSGRAARTVGDAMPFLRAAKTVDVVSVLGEKDLSRSVPGADVAPHLIRHGVNATVVDLKVEEGGVAETFRHYASRTGADMIVMGAYNHSRLREWILGGVTQSLLHATPVPLFLSH